MKSTRFAALLIGVLVSACTHTTTALTPKPIQTTMASTLSITLTGAFAEYTLPATFHPTAVANGSNNTVWFPSCDGTANLSNMATATGAVTTIKVPLPYKPTNGVAGRCDIANIGGYFWYPVQDPNEGVVDMARVGVTSTGAFTFSFFDTAYSGSSGMTNMVSAANALWFGVRFGPNVCSGAVGIPGVFASMSTSGAAGLSKKLPQAWFCTGSTGPTNFGYFQGDSVTPGADGNLYLTADSGTAGSLFNTLAAVFQISTTGTIHRFNLPSNSISFFQSGDLAIAQGRDGNLWITEPRLNEIATMSTTGTILQQHALPTANAGLTSITSAADGALWFTESTANKIGRITTAGAISEYPVPTASAHPTGIIPCPTTVCGTAGGVWFAETSVGKIARRSFPTSISCTREGMECAPSFPPCCPGLKCIPFSTRAFCEPYTAGTQYPRLQARGDAVAVVDTRRKTIKETIPVGRGAVGMAITPDGRKLYVADAFEDSISVVDTGRGIVIKTIPLAFRSTPTDVAVSWDGRTAYAYSGQYGVVSAIDTSTDKVASTPLDGVLLSRISAVKRCSRAIAGSPDASIVYIITGQESTADAVSDAADKLAAFVNGQSANASTAVL